MSTTLNLFEHLLARGRSLHALGLNHEATRLFERLSGFRLLPPLVAEETQKLLGELRLRRGQYKKARRHLAAAIANNPFQAGYHFMLASAVADDDAEEPERALEHFRQAVELEPKNADYWCELGLLAVEIGQTEEGLKGLRRAAELAPDSPVLLAKVVRGLYAADGLDEARSLLRTAMFRNSRDRRFRKLWNDFQFQVLHEEQQARQNPNPAENDGPIILPFVKPAATENTKRGRRMIRKDAPTPRSGPHGFRTSRLSDKEPA